MEKEEIKRNKRLLDGRGTEIGRDRSLWDGRRMEIHVVQDDVEADFEASRDDNDDEQSNHTE